MRIESDSPNNETFTANVSKRELQIIVAALDLPKWNCLPPSVSEVLIPMVKAIDEVLGLGTCTAPEVFSSNVVFF